ncbi:MAG: helix-hairpin-helix domain-containing protein [Gemmatales bacterium]|nr:helix-hairpin-helix domain-containing protein [Gemmatales bacterium]MDW8385773.1 Tex-like N-terminal domain-containing protein [Gemmatales bacterium]
MQDFNVPWDLGRIAQDLQIRKTQVETVAHLLDEGHSVPFLARYRRDQTGNLSEPVLRTIRRRLAHQRQLAQRKQTILKSIHGKGKLTEELRKAILSADSLHRLEDLFLAFKPKKPGAASTAREKGLEPLAQAIWQRDPVAASLAELLPTMVNPDKGLDTPEAVLEGVRALLTETITEQPEVRDAVRRVFWDTGRITAAIADGIPLEQAEEIRKHLPQPEAIRKIPPHRLLALERGEKEKKIVIRLECDQQQAIQAAAQKLPLTDHPHADLLRSCLEVAVRDGILPALETEIRRDLSERAEEQTVEIFAKNLHRLLLQPPHPARAVLALHPAGRGRCAFAVLDASGTPLEHGEMAFFEVRKKQPPPPAETASEASSASPTPASSDDTAPATPPVSTSDSPSQLAEAFVQSMADLIRRHGVEVLSLAQAPGIRAIEQLVLELIRKHMPELGYFFVNAAGIQRYATGAVGREEFPELSSEVRSAVAVGRRLLDPLSEWVKVEPQHLGVGLYSVNGGDKRLKEMLSDEIESCVNQVGVDVNRASLWLLRYVSGLNPLTARAIVEHRKQHGPFRSREQLKQVPGITEAVFLQAAGFLRIEEGDEPLDATWIHPEHYPAARWLMEQLNYPRETLGRGVTDPELRAKLEALSKEQVARELHLGLHALDEILNALLHPRKDPRDDLPRPVPKRGEARVEDLHPGMELQGTVVNVVDFGAFVDIGLRESALVHISQLANRFVRNPHEVVSVGDAVTVWVLNVDGERKRVSLTLIPPGTPRRGGRISASGGRQPPDQASGGRQPSGEASGGRQPPAKLSRRPRRHPPVPVEAQAAPAAINTEQPTEPPVAPPTEATGETISPPVVQRPKRLQNRPRDRRPPRPLPKLSEEALSGQVPLRTFAELMAYMQAKRQQ